MHADLLGRTNVSGRDTNVANPVDHYLAFNGSEVDPPRVNMDALPLSHAHSSGSFVSHSESDVDPTARALQQQDREASLYEDDLFSGE